MRAPSPWSVICIFFFQLRELITALRTGEEDSDEANGRWLAEEKKGYVLT